MYFSEFVLRLKLQNPIGIPQQPQRRRQRRHLRRKVWQQQRRGSSYFSGKSREKEKGGLLQQPSRRHRWRRTVRRAAAFVWFSLSLCQPSLSWNPQIAHQMNTAFSLTPVSFSVCSYCPPSPLLCAPHAFKAFCRRPSSCAYVKNNKPPLSFRMPWTRTRTNMVQLGFEPATIIDIGT